MLQLAFHGVLGPPVWHGQPGLGIAREAVRGIGALPGDGYAAAVTASLGVARALPYGILQRLIGQFDIR
ncbi:Uncharacterised protein [Mycobacteroides abscessus]|nr:Uncharacterised protein [Mycobacteroides abscessus]